MPVVLRRTGTSACPFDDIDTGTFTRALDTRWRRPARVSRRNERCRVSARPPKLLPWQATDDGHPAMTAKASCRLDRTQAGCDQVFAARCHEMRRITARDGACLIAGVEPQRFFCKASGPVIVTSCQRSARDVQAAARLAAVRLSHPAGSTAPAGSLRRPSACSHGDRLRCLCPAGGR